MPITKTDARSLNRQNKEDSLFVTFWGVRGTLPTPGWQTSKYGGNTSCVEINYYKRQALQTIILDAGSGIVRCGENALKRGDSIFHIVLTHMHYDHIIGLTKFTPFFKRNCKIHLYGHAKQTESFENAIKNIFRDPYFPVVFKNLPAAPNIVFHDLGKAQKCEINGLNFETLPLNHPQEATAYKIFSPLGEKNMVYATDHEHGTEKDKALKAFVKNTNLLIFDSTYSEFDFSRYKGWGHSTASFGAKISKDSNVGSYAIFHHDPDSSDKILEEKILPEAQGIFPRSFLAKERKTLVI